MNGRCRWGLPLLEQRSSRQALQEKENPSRYVSDVWCHCSLSEFPSSVLHRKQNRSDFAELPFLSARISFAWCIYIGSLSLSHLCSVLVVSPYYFKEHWILKLNNVCVIPYSILQIRLGRGVYRHKNQHFSGTSYPTVMISNHSSSSKMLLPPLTSHWVADITICPYLILLWCSILAMQWLWVQNGGGRVESC